jgi:carboxypeptidase-like protein
LDSRKIITSVFCLAAGFLNAQLFIKGKVVESDSSSAIPFVYIINKSNGNGTMSDNEGRFSMSTNINDTLICSYIGYAKAYIPVKQLKADANGEVRLLMQQILINLSTVNVTTFKIKPYERDYMNDIIDRSKIKTLDYFGSPFTAMYNQFSKEGRQVRKLAKIFEDIMEEEQVQQKLSREILVKLTGDDAIDYEGFRKYCYYVSNYYIITHEGFDLYSRVMECYRKYKAEGR